MLDTKVEVYNHIIESVRPGRGVALNELRLSKVMDVLIRDYDMYDTKLMELYTPENVFIFAEDLEAEFLIRFTCGDGHITTLHDLFDRFDFIRVNDVNGLVEEKSY